MSTSASSPASSKWDARYSTPILHTPLPVPHTASYYYKCMFGGVLACGLTHAAIVPLDVTKCRVQVYPQKYVNLVSSFKTIMKEEGIRGFSIGWFPTLVGYSMQGLCKFGFYEYFKDFYANLYGEQFFSKYKGWVWAQASASAEFFADIALCPMEMVKVKMQTSPVGTWPTNFRDASRKMIQNKADTRFPFGSIYPLWGRQIPYTIVKFYFFEKTVQMFYDYVFTQPKESYSKATQLNITFASGYIAGIICALVSQPQDNLVSQMGKEANKGKSFSQLYKEIGFSSLMSRGLGTRILMIGTLTGFQWWIYDTFKTFMGLGTTGGGSGKK